MIVIRRLWIFEYDNYDDYDIYFYHAKYLIVIDGKALIVSFDTLKLSWACEFDFPDYMVDASY